LPAEYYFDDLFIIDLLAGIEDENTSSMSISPNPSNGQFTISFNDYDFDKANMTISSMTGAIVYSESLNSVSNTIQNFNLDLKSGLYLVRVADDANEFTSRILIK
jgi:hypothetical protein